MKPVVAVYSTFLQRAFDMLIQDVGLQGLPVVFAVDRAGLVGDDGPTHHGAFDLSYLRLVPGLVVMAPSSQVELQHMLHTALRIGRPVALRYPRGLAAPSACRRSTPDSPGRQGERARGGLRRRPARHRHRRRYRKRRCAPVARGRSDPTVVDARFVKPLDGELLNDLAQTHDRIVTIEENSLVGGFGKRGRRASRTDSRERGPLRIARPLRASRRPRPPAGRGRPHAGGRRR